MNSIKKHLLFGICFILIVSFATVTGSTYWEIRSVLYSDFDKTLHQKAFVISTLVEFTERGLEIDFEPEDHSLIKGSSQELFFKIWREDGAVFSSSNGRSQSTDNVSFVLQKNQEFTTHVNSEGQEYRVAWLSFHPKIWEEVCLEEEKNGSNEIPLPKRLSSDSRRLSEELLVAVAVPRSEVDLILIQLGWFLGAASFFLLLIIPWMTYLILSYGLRPLNLVAKQISTYDGSDLKFRLTEKEVPVEIEPVVTGMNQVLQKIELVISRERSFSSDVAHELRTPLTGLQSQIEVCLKRDRTGPEYVETLQLCHDICLQSRTMVNSLLAVTQYEKNETEISKTRVQLSSILEECLFAIQQKMNQKQITLSAKHCDQIFVVSNEEKLQIILKNLFENAVNHCNSEGQIFLDVEKRDDEVILHLANSGNTVKEQEVGMVFERFWQGDSSRSKTGEHFGLGLYLVRQITQILGHRILVEVNEDKFLVTLFLPLAQSQ